MEGTMPEYRLIHLDSWPRKEHFQYYRTKIKCGYCLTGRLDVTGLVSRAKKQGLQTYPCFLYVISRTVNSMDEMKMMVDPQGAPGVWEQVHPNYTIFHQDDKTFSDLWSCYHPEFEVFYREYQQTLERYGSKRGIKLRNDQPPNFFCVSCVPWMDYTGYASYGAGEPNLFPIVTFGRYTTEGNKITMPLTVNISHAAADGYHTCRFFELLQQEMDRFGRGEL